ncbi:homoserine kinase [[Candida] jaroonii]|uniref:Homoserine kinase n=1 Tax=[Candida] jaroonii TaxID=467808 RepID=A0ACA9Y1I5_9ASCO|nr:homoserine kinase [[Candida] jaroonii]
MFKIKVPASSANIGPGFDVLGIGLNLYLEITLSNDSSDTSKDKHNGKIIYSGEGKENVPLETEKNLVTATALYVMRCNGMEKFPPGTVIEIHNPIPLGRGLGSSGAAIVGGSMIGNYYLGNKFSKERLLDYCLLIERHPDNIAAAMLGGFVGSYLNELDEKETQEKSVPLTSILPKEDTPATQIVSKPPPHKIGEYLKYNWNEKIKCIAIIPNFEVSTDDARSILPSSYEKADIIFNLQRLAILTSSLSQDPPNSQLIYNSMKDKLHQPYRSTLIPGLTKILDTLKPEENPGLCGICLSGAGPTILCLAVDNFDQLANKIIDMFKVEGIQCSWKLLELAYDGATTKN